MVDGTLVAWKKKIGDVIVAGEIIAEIETDKATMEWEATDDGVLTEIYIQEGGKVGVGAAIALVLGKGEKRPERVAVVEAPLPQSSPDAVSASNDSEIALNLIVDQERAFPNERIKASPLAKKIAAEKGLNLLKITGTGPGGRIIEADVTGSVPAKTAVKSVVVVSGGLEEKRIPLSGMRRVIAERLQLSKSTIPHFYLNIEVDAEPMMKLRAELNGAFEAEKGIKLTVNDFVLQAVIRAAMKVPAVNASFAGDVIIQYGGIHLSVAIAVDEGLVTPVVRDAQSKTIFEVSRTVKDLATRARTKKLKPDEYQGGTLTVSNLGAYGVETFSAIINPPQSMIVSVGAIVKKPVVGRSDQIIVGQRMNIGLSADHRVVDGAIGAQYLAELRKLIESPALLLL